MFYPNDIVWHVNGRVGLVVEGSSTDTSYIKILMWGRSNGSRGSRWIPVMAHTCSLNLVARQEEWDV